MTSEVLTLVLASGSAVRVRLLRDAGVAFETMPAAVDETAVIASLQAEGAAPRAIADALAEMKAIKISTRLGRGALVLGADQVLDCEGRIFEKPADLDEARAHLLALRGRSHTLHTAIVIAQNGAPVWRQVSGARLEMRAFSDDFLEAYLSDCGEAICASCGAYQIEGRGIQLFTRIEGSFSAIQGLDLPPLLGYLRERGLMRT